MIEAAKILDQLIILVMNIQKFTDYTEINEDGNRYITHTIPTILRRVNDSCRMRCEANQINPIFLTVNCLQRSGNN